MKQYKVNYIKEFVDEVTNQNLIYVSISPSFANSTKEFGKINFEGLKSLLDTKYLKVASDSEYSKYLLSCYLNNELFNLDITFFLGIYETSNNIKKMVYYHESVKKEHLIELNLPFFDIKFKKTNNNIDIIWDHEISKISIDIALKDIIIFIKFNLVKLNDEKKLPDGSLNIKVLKFNRELNSTEIELQKQKKFPYNKVQIDSIGFSISEIKEVMQNFKLSLPESMTSRFLYDVDFINLKLRG